MIRRFFFFGGGLRPYVSESYKLSELNGTSSTGSQMALDTLGRAAIDSLHVSMANDKSYKRL